MYTQLRKQDLILPKAQQGQSCWMFTYKVVRESVHQYCQPVVKVQCFVCCTVCLHKALYTYKKVERYIRIVVLLKVYFCGIICLLISSPTLVIFRSASPKHGFTIMNRLSMENRTEPITKDLDFQLQDPFLLYRNARCESFLMHWVVLFLQFGQVFKNVQQRPLCLCSVSVTVRVSVS